MALIQKKRDKTNLVCKSNRMAARLGETHFRWVGRKSASSESASLPCGKEPVVLRY
jgi:hypothetical protein